MPLARGIFFMYKTLGHFNESDTIKNGFYGGFL